MGEHTMRCAIVAIVAVTLAMVVAIPAEEQTLDAAQTFVDEKPEATKLQAKLAKLEHTYNRIKKSCTANDIPKELGEADDSGEKAKATTVQELKEKIKKKNAQIDKIADACMPGEERSQFGME